MPKLSEIEQNKLLKVLLVGTPGTGKTVAACGFPYPILAFDFDNKINSAARWYSKDTERMNNIEVKNMSKRLDGGDVIPEFNKIVEDEILTPLKNGTMKYKTIIIDSVTTFSSAVLWHIVKTNPGIKRVTSAQGVQPGQQDYGILKREFAKVIPGTLSLAVNVVMCAHIDVDKDALTGEIIRGPLMDGSFAQELPIYFEEVYRVFMKDGKPMAQTQSDLYHNFCRSQIPGLPNPIELKYDNLIKGYK